MTTHIEKLTAIVRKHVTDHPACNSLTASQREALITRIVQDDAFKTARNEGWSFPREDDPFEIGCHIENRQRLDPVMFRPIPSLSQVHEHLMAKRARVTGQPAMGEDRIETYRQAQELVRDPDAVMALLPFDPAKPAVEVEKPADAKPTSYAAMSPEQRVDHVARLLSKPPGDVLPSDLRKFEEANAPKVVDIGTTRRGRETRMTLGSVAVENTRRELAQLEARDPSTLSNVDRLNLHRAREALKGA